MAYEQGYASTCMKWAPACLPYFKVLNLCMRLGHYFISCFYLSPCSLNSELSQSFKWYEDRFVHLYRNQDIRQEVRTLMVATDTRRLSRCGEEAQSAFQLTHSDVGCVHCKVLLCWLLVSITMCMYSLVPSGTTRGRAWCLPSANKCPFQEFLEKCFTKGHLHYTNL